MLLADHAGSGKTLAYLLPLLQLLREEERFLGRAATQPRCPRLLVVVPTAELAAQAGRVCRALSRAGFPFRSAAVTGGHPMRTQRELLEAGVDVLVGTPGRLLELITSGSLSLEFCRAVVLDEVDVLLSSALAFSEQVRPLHAAASETTRFVFVSATVPKDLYLELEEEFPGLAAALGPGLHRTAPGSTQQLVDCSGGEEVSEETGWQRKAEALLAVLQERRAPRTMVSWGSGPGSQWSLAQGAYCLAIHGSDFPPLASWAHWGVNQVTVAIPLPLSPCRTLLLLLLLLHAAAATGVLQQD